MIIKSFDTVKKYLPTIGLKLDNSIIEDALQVAEEDITEKILGEELRNLIEGNRENKDYNDLRILTERVISNLAFMNSIPEIDLILTEQGFAVFDGSGYNPASRQRVDALLKNITEKVNNSLDKLVTFLVKSKKYEYWRSSEQFNYLSSAMVYSFSEFNKIVAIQDSAPKNYMEFYNIIPELYSALYSPVAAYLSCEYIDELVEKVRDKEVISVNEIRVTNLVKEAICLHVSNRKENAHIKTMQALQILRNNPEEFPTFTSSPEAARLDIKREDSPVYMMLG